MRTLLLSLAAATTMVTAATLTAPRADAMTVGTASGIQAAIQDDQMIQDVRLVCRHRAFSSRQVCREVVVVCRHRPFSSRRVCY